MSIGCQHNHEVSAQGCIHYLCGGNLSALAQGSQPGLAMAYECGVPRNLEKAIALYKKTPNYFKGFDEPADFFLELPDF
jgi:hypothetical protein